MERDRDDVSGVTPAIDCQETAMTLGDEQSEFQLTPFDRELHELIQQGVGHAPDSLQCRKLRNELVRRIQKANVLYRPKTPEERAFYADALSVMWQYFFEHLWQSDRARPFSTQGYPIVGRLNMRLKGQLKDLLKKARKKDSRQEFHKFMDGEWLDPLERLPAKAESELPPLETALSDWLNTEAEIQEIHIRGRSDITGAIVIRRKLLEDKTWRTIADELKSNIPALSAFYERECRPRLQRFCQDYGYHD